MRKMRKYLWVWLSDLHLELDLGQGCYIPILEKINPTRIGLNGDLHKKDEPIHEKNQPFLAWLKANRKIVVHVRGNHDPKRKSILGGKTVRKCRGVINGKKWQALHGHKFDWFGRLWKKRWVDRICDFVFWLLKKEKRHIGPWMETYHHQCHCDARQQAFPYAKKHGLWRIITGHTHRSEHSVIDGIEYINLGYWDWYATVDHQGVAKLHQINSIFE